jgi:hypothetical protein
MDTDTTATTSISIQLESGVNTQFGNGVVFPAMTSDSIDPTPANTLVPLSQTGTFTVDNSARSMRIYVIIAGTPTSVGLGNIVIDYTLGTL